MDLFQELMRIAKVVNNTKDAEIIRQAAVKCIPDPTPVFDETTIVKNVGYVRHRTY